MPGKVNPVMSESLMQVAARAIGNDATIALCGAAGGQFQLNIMMPVMGHVTLESLRILTGATLAFTRRCLTGMRANVEVCNDEVERSPAMATGPNAYIGYEQAAKICQRVHGHGQDGSSAFAAEKNILPEDQLGEAARSLEDDAAGVIVSGSESRFTRPISNASEVRSRRPILGFPRAPRDPGLEWLPTD